MRQPHDDRPALPILLAFVLLAACGGEPPAAPFEPLFQLELAAEDGVGDHVVADDSLDRSFRMSRDLVAQGEGLLAGSRLAGSFRWSLLGRKHPDWPYARLHLTGWLETADGAEMFLRATGYAHDGGGRITGSTAMSLAGGFEVELEPDHEWLNSVVLLLEGGLETGSETFTLRAWAPTAALAAAP